MLTVRSSTPKSSASKTALFFVRFVVPNPGIVSDKISNAGRFSNLNVSATTSNASVESRPPESPITARLEREASRRFARPAHWIEMGANMSLGDMFLRFDSREELDNIMAKSREWMTIELEG